MSELETPENKMQRFLILADECKKENPQKAHSYYRFAINSATGVINNCLSEMDVCLYALKEDEKG